MRTQKSKRNLRRFMIAKELIMVSLVVASLGLLVAEHIVHFSRTQLVFIEAIEIFVALVLLAELSFEWYHAKNRKKYFKEHWIYLIAAIPLPIYTFELLRSIRLLRLLRLFKMFAHLRYEQNTQLFSR